ncbi:tRNA (adenosine(37)-N6)-threonylcarbamoyltransferase complex transferase subunit TsaD [Victivallis vadensis]|uniref:tRNA N6-adenosine threonylcarbamoyltransferase n=1 Tax=Victivallis vadensis TaxID=172901 RepID=A0A848AMX2_9BACT|nr:tRNA (adenosine(37)-N6)-threonylcarbamoyltransferase complex transferase subunit TsaD [Victivallis vadensis]NMD85274.1 tRNA (adenosine(37)-N6)-threonylcarbamoyltransferase complex transferase subunit TsaD [Victivallis vadensis]PWM89472.1 MAG: tRNA (adenosine(37)-N6)-threonylcarbamoyltransferase complex transferase subunit TsaD [Lentisphaerota bacterium]HJH06025.1 tRNA (adenosine(37)-N6)-threonylcarbamoyltransferase complex transferase subunit TsaD [Victivallis vadensis]
MSLILGIESSCDETAAAVVRDGYQVLSSCVASQIAKHAVHGGVVPELAAREHLVALNPVVEGALREAGVTMKEIGAIAVTQGPGLIPALLVGLSFAKGLAMGNGKPLIGVNHFIAHIYGAFLDEAHGVLENPATYPLLALVVSGGHTSLMLIERDGKARQLGCTIDDAAGEALDKGAKLLGLGYPGGPIMQKTAEGGDPHKYEFPRPLTGGAGKPLAPENLYNFSFSGIKTALLYHVKHHAGADGKLPAELLRDTVASYQEAVVDVLTRKTLLAAKNFGAKTIVVAGGVACNSVLRERFEALTPKHVQLRLAARKYCTDNAAMVGGLGWHYHRKQAYSPLNIDSFARLPQITQVPFLGE